MYQQLLPPPFWRSGDLQHPFYSPFYYSSSPLQFSTLLNPLRLRRRLQLRTLLMQLLASTGFQEWTAPPTNPFFSVLVPSELRRKFYFSPVELCRYNST